MGKRGSASGVGEREHSRGLQCGVECCGTYNLHFFLYYSYLRCGHDRLQGTAGDYAQTPLCILFDILGSSSLFGVALSRLA